MVSYNATIGGVGEIKGLFVLFPTTASESTITSKLQV